jgi:signal peptidase I
MTEQATPTTEPELPPESRGRWLWRQVRAFVFIFVILAALRSAVADWNDVPSGSMIPTILEGDRIFVNKLAYDLKVPFTTMHLATWDNPHRGDVVVFFSPDEGIRLVKRVVAEPGDVLELRDNHLYLNGAPSAYGPADDKALAQLGDDYRHGRIFSTEREPSSSHIHPVTVTPSLRNEYRSFGPVTVPAGQYFMMGDNRDNSRDSRYFGFVTRDRIVGRAVAIVASLDLNHHWVPRWARFFKSLP